jgi:hypothetical protein
MTQLALTRRSVPVGVWYTLAVLGFALLVVFAQLAIHTRRIEPRNSLAIVERELRMNTLQPGERIVKSVPVFRRTGVDYFRRTRGMLVLTDKRLVYLGAPPRDITGASNFATVFDQQEFSLDTLVRVKKTFVVLGLVRGLRIDAPEGDLKLGVPSRDWPQAQVLREAWLSQHKHLYTLGVWAGRVREARKQLQRELEAYRKQPIYHVVRPGDAISSIASWYETSPEKIAELNGIVGNKIKIGQRLLIRSGS